MHIDTSALPGQLKQIGLVSGGALVGSMLANTLSSGQRRNGPLLVLLCGAAVTVFAKDPRVKSVGMGAAAMGLTKAVARHVPTLAGTLEGWVDAANEQLSPAPPVEAIGYTIVEDTSTAPYQSLNL